MAKKGFTSLEALIALAVSFAVLAGFIGIEAQGLESTRTAAQKFISIVEAEKCALLADSLYANSSPDGAGLGPKNLGDKCRISGNRFYSNEGGKEGSAVMLNKFTSEGMKIDAESHYREQGSDVFP